MFYPYGTVETNSKYVAVIYVKTMDDEYEAGGSLIYFLATYDPKGTIIDKMMIAGRSAITDPIKTFNNKPLSILLKSISFRQLLDI